MWYPPLACCDQLEELAEILCGFAPLAHLLTTSSHFPLAPSLPSSFPPSPSLPTPLPSPSLLVPFIVFEVNKGTSGIPGANGAETCRGGACGSVRTWISLRSGPFTVSYCPRGGSARRQIRAEIPVLVPRVRRKTLARSGASGTSKFSTPSLLPPFL